MYDAEETLYTFLAAMLLAVMLIGSPLSSFGCQTVVPEQFQVPCETSLGETAVQSNFFQPATAAITIFAMLTVVCWLTPQHHLPQERHLLPPLPPPRRPQF